MFEREVLHKGSDEITSVLALHPDLPAAPPGESPQHDKSASTLPEGAPSVCAAVLGRLKDGQLFLESRQGFLAMAICLPRWLWPEPPKPPGTVLAPRSRPRLLQAQAQLLHDGDLQTLLASLQAEEEHAPPQHLPPRTPSHLTHADCQRLLQAGKQGRFTTAWKQLRSHAWGSGQQSADGTKT